MRWWKREINGRVVCGLGFRTGWDGEREIRGWVVVIVCLVQPETPDKLDNHNCKIIWPVGP